MRAPNDQHHVVLAMRDEANVAQEHHLIISVGLLERAFQEVIRVLVVAGEPLLIGADDARGVSINPSRLSPTQAMRVFTACSASARDGRITCLPRVWTPRWE